MMGNDFCDKNPVFQFEKEEIETSGKAAPARN